MCAREFMMLESSEVHRCGPAANVCTCGVGVLVVFTYWYFGSVDVPEVV